MHTMHEETQYARMPRGVVDRNLLANPEKDTRHNTDLRRVGSPSSAKLKKSTRWMRLSTLTCPKVRRSCGNVLGQRPVRFLLGRAPGEVFP